jgi:hypothetical protein
VLTRGLTGDEYAVSEKNTIDKANSGQRKCDGRQVMTKAYMAFRGQVS